MKAVYRAGEGAAWALFASEPYLHVAGVGAHGQPVLRTFNVAVVDRALVFHTSTHGEKRELLNQPVVAQVERPLGVIPSYFVDPELACPATTYFLSAQARGVLREVVEPADKARYLAAFMRRHQPEGGYAPLRADDPRYASVLRGLWVAVLRPDEVVAKHKLGQNRSGRVMEGVQQGLWQRGAPGDLALIRALREQHPARPCPPRLRAAEGHVLCPSPDAEDAAQVAELLEGQYWWPEGRSRAQREATQQGSTAWIVARNPEGRVRASARALSDGARHATVCDVVVHPEDRGDGLGTALLGALLDHPRLRGVERVELRTRDAQPFYARFGFVEHPGEEARMQLRPSSGAAR